MARNPRDGRIESNLARSPIFDANTKGKPSPAPISARSLLGMEQAKASRRLSMIDLAVLAWACAKIPPEGDPIAEGTIYQLGQAIYGREPAGKERRILMESFDRLLDCVVRMPGFDATRGKQVSQLVQGVSKGHLVQAVYVEHREWQLITANKLGAIRSGNLRIELANWLARQVRAGFVTFLDLEKLQALGPGLAARLWAYLEAESYKPISSGQEGSWIGLAEPALATLGLERYERHRDARRALDRAGDRICEVDPTYERVGCERRPGGYALIAIRRVGAARAEAKKIRNAARASLASAAEALADQQELRFD